MVETSQRSRTSSGVPTGGEFAREQRDENEDLAPSGTREAGRQAALDLMARLNADPESLPPVDDPYIPDGVDEDEGWIDSMERLADPRTAGGACVTVSEAVQMTDPDFRYFEQELNGATLNVHATNLLPEHLTPAGETWVCDFTFAQMDPDAPFPYIAPLDEWKARCDVFKDMPPAHCR